MGDNVDMSIFALGVTIPDLAWCFELYIGIKFLALYVLVVRFQDSTDGFYLFLMPNSGFIGRSLEKRNGRASPELVFIAEAL